MSGKQSTLLLKNFVFFCLTNLRLKGFRFPIISFFYFLGLRFFIVRKFLIYSFSHLNYISIHIIVVVFCVHLLKDRSSKFCSKHSTNTVLCLLRNLLEQSLLKTLSVLFQLIQRGKPFKGGYSSREDTNLI